MVEMTAMSFIIQPFFQVSNNRTLPFKIWLPYDLSSDKIFWVTFAPEAAAIMLASLLSVSSNTLVFGFLIKTCGQFDILSYRFSILPEYDKKEEKTLVIRNIQHHQFIFKFVIIITLFYYISIDKFI